jgi:sortase A
MNVTHRLMAFLFLSSLGLAACQGYGPMSPVLVAEKVLFNEPAAAAPVADTAADSTAGDTSVTDAPSAPTAAALAAAVPLTTTAPVTRSAADDLAGANPAAAGVVAAATTADYSPTMPVGLAIPAVDLQAQVAPMGWEPIMQGDQVTTAWIVPEQTLGWAVNSAGAGEPGNVIIVGHQAVGAAIFRPLALGDVTVGQEIAVQAADGTTYLYRVRDVSDPIAAIGASAEEQAQAAAYLAPAPDARLTLISGWPADATTHRVFVVAEYVGVQP